MVDGGAGLVRGKRLRWSGSWVALGLVLMSGCKEAPRVAQKSIIREQILAADKKPLRLPPPAIVADTLDKDAAARRHVLTMSEREMWARLDHFRLRVKVVYESPHTAPISEEHVVRQAPSGRFSTHHQSANEIVDWIVTNEVSLVKKNKGEWRSQPVRFEQIEMERDVAGQSARDLFALFGDDLKLGPPQTEHQGAGAIKYALSAQKAQAPKPDAGEKKTHPDTDPDRLSGTLIVDPKTAVPLSIEIKANLLVHPLPAQKNTALPEGFKPTPVPAGDTAMAVKLSWTIDGFEDGAGEKLEPTMPKAIAESGAYRPPMEPLGFWKPNQKGASAEQDEEE